MSEIDSGLVEMWLGTSNPLKEAIEVLVDIANGVYTPEVLRQDILDLEIEMSDYAHCASCDKVLNLDKDSYAVTDQDTFCQQCADKVLPPVFSKE